MNFSINFKKIINLILLLLVIFVDLYIIKYFYDTYQSKKENNLLNEISLKNSSSNMYNNGIVDKTDEQKNSEEKQDEEKETQSSEKESENSDNEYTKTERMLKLEELQRQNSDIKAWLEIENTDINYPVLQTTDNEYYMKHNYKKQYSINGSVFLDKDCKWEPLSANLLIYGHNMKNNTMFQSLLKYKDKNFYDAHPLVRFTTNKEDAYYEIFSVFESRVYYKSEKNVFRYYFFVNCNNSQEFDEYVQNAKKASLYDTGKSASFGDKLMTLSTCSYHTKDGRFAVIAKKR